MNRRVTLMGARAWVPGIQFYNAHTPNLPTHKRELREAEFLTLLIAIIARGGTTSAWISEVRLFFTFYLVSRAIKEMFNLTMANSSSRVIAEYIRAATLILALPFVAVSALHHPWLLSSYFQLYADCAMDIVETSGNWGVRMIHKRRVTAAPRRLAASLNGLVTTVLVLSPSGLMARMLRQTTFVERGVGPPFRSRLLLCVSVP